MFLSFSGCTVTFIKTSRRGFFKINALVKMCGNLGQLGLKSLVSRVYLSTFSL